MDPIQPETHIFMQTLPITRTMKSTLGILSMSQSKHIFLSDGQLLTSVWETGGIDGLFRKEGHNVNSQGQNEAVGRKPAVQGFVGI
jgi:hypothetical protein